MALWLGLSPGCGGSNGVEVVENPPPMPEGTFCVVSDEPAEPGYTVSYRGKLYYLCCKKCIKAFKANPERYADPAPVGNDPS